MTDSNITKSNMPFHGHFKRFPLPTKHVLRYFFFLAIAIALIVPLFTPYSIAPFIKALASKQTTAPSFTFTAGGDIGGNAATAATLNLLAASSSQFHLVLGDLSYSEITPESAWCSYVQSHIGTTFPFELVSGNHEDGGERQDGLIDNFTQCFPDRLGAVGTYGKEYYFDYPASAPIARFIMMSPALTFTNGGYYDYSAGTSHYNWVSNTIDSARTSGIKWVIAGMHKTCISIGVDPCDIGKDLYNLLISKKVDLILQAHDHDYQRSKQLAFNGTTCTAIQDKTYNSNCVTNDGSTGSYTKNAGPVSLIIGSVGETLEPINTSDGDKGYFSSWMGSNITPTNGLTKFTLSADKLSVAANFMGSSTSSTFSDAFTITDTSPTPTTTTTPTLTPTATPPAGAISLRATTAGNNAAGSSTLAINTPAGTTSGDVMIAHVIVRTAGNSITPPTGWSLVARQDSSSSISTAAYMKVAGASEPASYTWGFGTSGQASGGIASYIGVDTTTPVDASHTQYNSGSSATTNTGVTTTAANDMVVDAVGVTVATTVNVPTGFTAEWSTTSTSTTTSEMSQQVFPSIGATGTVQGTHNGGANSNITILIALKPGAGTLTPTPTTTATSTPTATATSTPTITPTTTTTPTAGSISLRATAAGNNAAGSKTLTINTPAGTTSGDVMIAHVIVRSASNVITPPTGWSLVARQNSSSSIATAAYMKVAGASEPTSYSWGFGTSGQASGGIASYLGVNTTTPVDASHAQYNDSSSTTTNTGVTTTAANDMLVDAVGITTATTVNVPTGFTAEWSTTSTSTTTSEMSQKIFPSIGATGTVQGTHNGGSSSNITILIALKHS